MITFAHYIKTKYLNKDVLVDCFNSTQLQGTIEKVHATFIVLKQNKKTLSVNLNSVAFVQEAEK